MSPQTDADINPYASPSHMAAIAEPERPRFRIVAIIVGCLVDIASSVVAGILLGIVLGMVLIAQGASLQQMQQALSTSASVLVGGLLIGTCGSILGGYVAAWMAGQRELQHALATGLLSVTLGIAMMVLHSLSPIPVTQPTWLNITAFMLTVPAAVFGGWLRRLVAGRNRK
jgi:hypothetical protein